MNKCTDCIIDLTDACPRGAGRAIDDEVCDSFISRETYEVNKNESWQLGYQQGRADAIDEVKKCLAMLLIKSDDIDYSFNDGHWGLVFSIFAKEFGLKDTEIYELAEQLKSQK